MDKRKVKRELKRFARIPHVLNKVIVNSYYVHKLVRSPLQKKTILLESKQGSEIAGNIFYTLMALQAPEFREYSVNIACAPEQREAFERLLRRYGMTHVNVVDRKSLRYRSLLATAKYLFNDTTFPYYYVKRDGQIYTNTWHGTPLKHMGRDVVNRVYAMGNVKRNLVMADYLVYPNREMEEKMLAAYMIGRYSKGSILNTGYPRNAVFFDGERAAEVKKLIGCEGKRVYVYMPTWRGTLSRLGTERQERDLIRMFDVLEEAFDDDQVLLVKMHPLARSSLDLSGYARVVDFPEGWETYDVLNCADVLVTDYSSVMFDYANSGKKIVLYVYDREEYEEQRGLYYSLDELPFPKAETPEELAVELTAPKGYDDTELKERFCTYDCYGADVVLANYVVRGIPDVRLSKKRANYADEGRPNDLYYVADLSGNGLTAAFLALASETAGSGRNIVATFKPTRALRRHPERIEKLPPNVDVFPIASGGRCYTFSERVAWEFYYKLNIETKWIRKKVDQFFEREGRRYFGGARLNVAIHQTGYGPDTIGMFKNIGIPNAIFVHNDMLSEVNTRKNQHVLTLKDAYKTYDRVVCVTSDIVEPTLQFCDCNERIRVVNNFVSFDGIREKAHEEICYNKATLANVRQSVLQALLAQKDVIKFINIGRYSPEKGHFRLIDAFDKFHEIHPNSLLVIVGGNGKEWSNTNEYIKTKKSRYAIVLIKSIDNPYPILRQCDCFVFSSFYEALGLVIIEAQTCGVPVVSTDVRGPRGFMLEHGGYLVEDSEEGIFNGMTDFVDGKVSLMDFDENAYNAKNRCDFVNLLAELDEQ